MVTRHVGNVTAPCGDATGPDKLLDTAFAFWRAALLLSTDELGLFAALTEGPLTASALQTPLGLDGETAPDFLAALLPLGVIKQRGERYELSASAAPFLDPAWPAYIGSWLAMARAAMQEAPGLTARLRDATPATQMWTDIAAILGAATLD